jgi:hypothetical protein
MFGGTRAVVSQIWAPKSAAPSMVVIPNDSRGIPPPKALGNFNGIPPAFE